MIGIITAETKELEAVLNCLTIKEKKKIYDKTFYIGTINNKDIVLVKSNVGKVNSARTTQILIDKFNVRLVINIGTAGSVDNSLNIGDVVVADKLYQYDFDVTIFGRKLGEIENIGEYIKTDNKLLSIFNNENVIIGGIASGDRFIYKKEEKDFIRNAFNVKCIEMEGASIAQTCFLSNIPFIIIRSITDKLDGSSKVEFEEFLEYSSKKCVEILKRIINSTL